MTALFYANGIYEGLTGLVMYNYPETFCKGKRVNENGRMFARTCGTLLGAFGIGSILIAKQPDSPTKHLFSVGWLIFHVSTLMDQSLRERKKILSLVHASLSVAFIYYVYSTGVEKQTFMLWRISDQLKARK